MSFKFFEDHVIAGVAVVGALGGALSWMARMSGLLPPTTHWMPDLLFAICLGSGASIVFVFVLANTDRKDVYRIIGLALLAGFSYKSVWEAGGAFFDLTIEEHRQADAEEGIGQMISMVAPLTSGEKLPTTAQIKTIVRDTSRLNALIENVDSVERRETLRASAATLLESLEAIGFTLRKADRSTDALAVFNSAADIDPTFAPAQLGRGLVLNSMSRSREANIAVYRAFELDPALFSKPRFLEIVPEIAEFIPPQSIAPDGNHDLSDGLRLPG